MSRIETIGNATLYLGDCLEVMAGDSMVIEARDMGDGIFKSGFEVWP